MFELTVRGDRTGGFQNTQRWVLASTHRAADQHLFLVLQRLVTIGLALLLEHMQLCQPAHASRHEHLSADQSVAIEHIRHDLMHGVCCQQRLKQA